MLTTPPSVLVLALIGLFATGAPIFLRVFLAINVVFPQARLLMPGTRDFDGVRHFLEFYPSACALAAIGLGQCVDLMQRVRAGIPWRVLLPVAALAPGVLGVASTYPYGTCYFNSLVGGLAGAQKAGVPQATDYWAASYWHGAAWLSEHAEPNAGLYVPIAEQVAQVIAPVRLRPDIALGPDGLEDCPGPIYVMYVTRRDFYGVLTRHLDANDTPVHEVLVQGGTILRIFRFESDAEKQALFAVLTEERLFNRLRVHFIEWVRADPSHPDRVAQAMASDARGDRTGAIRLLRDAMPVIDDGQAELVIDWLRGISL